MIKTNELMLGDLVRLADGQTAKVVAIDVMSDIYVEFVEKGFLNRIRVRVHEEELNPIPFTGEDLENNGFVFENSECSNIDSFRLKCGSGGSIEINNFDGLYFYVMLTWKETKLEYVHQLQHLLRLCGSNELADNLKIE